MLDGLYKIVSESGVELSECLIFLPSRRAVRVAEKMFAEKNGGAVILPKLVALGEGVDSEEIVTPDTFSNMERIVLLAKLISQDVNINISVALSLAHDFVRMQDYLENEGIDSSQIQWREIVQNYKYPEHFDLKAQMLEILTGVLPTLANGRKTSTQIRNDDVRAWKNEIQKYPLVVVCGSTASVPVTAELMVAVAKSQNGRIILPGKIDGRVQDFALNTNPYNAEYKWLSRVGIEMDDIIKLDFGESDIDFMNYAFGNDTNQYGGNKNLCNCHLIECDSESIEASAVAEICKDAMQQNKTVMVVTPDAAGNQRIAAAFNGAGLEADFSGAKSGTETEAGRAILNLLNSWIESEPGKWDELYKNANFNLFDTVASMLIKYSDDMHPGFEIDSTESGQVWYAIKNLSECLEKYDIKLSCFEARSFIADALSGVSVRDVVKGDAKIVVLGTIESRMQTADVVILTGLNEGMFPARGYENTWLPVHLSDAIGLPSRDRKVSLMSLDFMNLSCGPNVYWLRSLVSGGAKTTESRFISRVVARGGEFDKEIAESVLQKVKSADVVEPEPLDKTMSIPDSDWGDVYVTKLEKLIHNPYLFYVSHILKLDQKKDWWMGVDAMDFGNLVHSVIEHAKEFSVEKTVRAMDLAALDALKTDNRNNMQFRFWHKRFIEIANLVEKNAELLSKSVPEKVGKVYIDGQHICAKADRVWDGGVMDIKTGGIPTDTQLENGMMPQLPIEAFMLTQKGFDCLKATDKSLNPEMVFMKLKNFDVDMVWIRGDQVRQMMDAAVNKVKELVDRYCVGKMPYEYLPVTDIKYKGYEDLARIDD